MPYTVALTSTFPATLRNSARGVRAGEGAGVSGSGHLAGGERVGPGMVREVCLVAVARRR